MKASVMLFALTAACSALTACGGTASDEVEADSAELRGVEPDEIDYDDSDDDEAAGTNRGVWRSLDHGGIAATGGASGEAIGSANGGIWKSSNFGPTATGGAAGVTRGSGGASGTAGPTGAGGLVTYGPVITIKPKG